MGYKPNSAHPIVTLTTDFGLSDTYVAAMKGAILRQSPSAVLVDVTHNVPPGDVLCGSISLERAVDGFGPGAVHLAVVDPGVGTDRRILLVQIRGSIVVCPDNGLITWTWRRLGPAAAGKLIWKPRRKASDTFHGRDAAKRCSEIRVTFVRRTFLKIPGPVNSAPDGRRKSGRPRPSRSPGCNASWSPER